MGDRLAGKRALISAAAQGIGRAAALAMAEEGAQVFATDVNETVLAELTHPNIETFLMDVRDDASVTAGVARATPDVLFNAAGFVHHGTVLDATDAEWDFAFDLNVRSMYRTIRAALPGMLERKSGSIINMASALGSKIGAPNRFVYGATKAAIEGITKSVARDFITTGVRCNCICPGTVDTPSLQDRIKALGETMGGYDAALESFVARQPMGRMAQPEEIGALAVYLASDESGFTTGQQFYIDGGWSG